MEPFLQLQGPTRQGKDKDKDKGKDKGKGKDKAGRKQRLEIDKRNLRHNQAFASMTRTFVSWMHFRVRVRVTLDNDKTR
jgi:hypothetical protein